jgi:hypothetical protein
MSPQQCPNGRINLLHLIKFDVPMDGPSNYRGEFSWFSRQACALEYSGSDSEFSDSHLRVRQQLNRGILQSCSIFHRSAVFLFYN